MSDAFNTFLLFFCLLFIVFAEVDKHLYYRKVIKLLEDSIDAATARRPAIRTTTNND